MEFLVLTLSLQVGSVWVHSWERFENKKKIEKIFNWEASAWMDYLYAYRRKYERFSAKLLMVVVGCSLKIYFMVIPQCGLNKEWRATPLSKENLCQPFAQWKYFFGGGEVILECVPRIFVWFHWKLRKSWRFSLGGGFNNPYLRKNILLFCGSL